MRIYNRLNLRDLADKIGVSPASVAKYEKGYGINLTKLVRLSELFSVSTDFILKGVEASPRVGELEEIIEQLRGERDLLKEKVNFYKEQVAFYRKKGD